MANQLAMGKVLAIKALAAAGRSERQIAAALSVSRKAVRRHLGRSNSKETKAPTGLTETKETKTPTGSIEAKETQSPTGSSEVEKAAAPAVLEPSIASAPKTGSRSLCVSFHETILKKVEQGLTAQRVFQDPYNEHGFSGKYSSVRRYVRALGDRRPRGTRQFDESRRPLRGLQPRGVLTCSGQASLLLQLVVADLDNL